MKILLLGKYFGEKIHSSSTKKKKKNLRCFLLNVFNNGVLKACYMKSVCWPILEIRDEHKFGRREKGSK